MKLVVLLVLAFLAPALADWDWGQDSLLDEYLDIVDPGLPTWEEEDEYFFDLCHIKIYNFTSLIWEDDTWSNRPVWWHYLIVFYPNVDQLRFNEDAFYWVEGKDNDDPLPNATDGSIPFSCLLSNQSEAAVAIIRMVPNQPIVYADDEDQIERFDENNIAYTWRHVLDNSNEQPERLMQYPMTKAAVKGLDVFHSVLQLEFPMSDIDEFTVGGTVQQGWIAWLMACTDPRVRFVIPMTGTLLNVVANLKTHYMSLGGWSWAYREYYWMNITEDIDSALFDNIMDPIDAFNYAPRLTMPKLIIGATGDEVYLPDDTHLYFDHLPEPKFILMMQNADIAFYGHWRKMFGTISIMFYLMNEPGGPANLPNLNWTCEWHEDDHHGEVTLDIDPLPDIVTAFWADTPSPEHRDYRMVTLEGPSEIVWRRWWNGNGTLEQIDEDSFRYTHDESVDAPYRGMFINVKYHVPRYDHFNITMQLTTEVQTIPDTYPHPPCVGTGCKGELV